MQPLARQTPLFSSSAYGLALHSNCAIPGLPSRPALAPGTGVTMILGESPAWAGDTVDPATPRHRAVGDGRHALRYADDTRFYLDLPAATIWATWREPLTLEDTATYLLGPVMGFFLRLSGRVCLHGSVALFGERAVAFIGPAGSGKSTLAAALARSGTPIVTEDVACLDEGGGAFCVRPGYPRIRLWPDSPAARGPLPKLTPNWDKAYVELGDARLRFQESPAPLAGIYVLAPREAMAAPARADALDGQDALRHLIANTYGQRLVDREMRAHEFGVLGRLARAVPVRALALNAEGTRLAAACDWLRDHALP